MASTSASHSNNDVPARLRTAATTICSENQSLVSEIRKTVALMKDLAVDFEKDKKSDLVKDLESGVIQLLEAADDCMFLSNAVQSVGDSYQPGQEAQTQRTDFKKLIDNEIVKSKANSSSALASQKAQMLRKFQEAIWNVHHSGQPMPGEENEDIVMTSTECSILNKKCPVTGIQVTELADPVRNVDCKHIYEKAAILLYVASKNNSCPCPVAGCPKSVNKEKVLCDPMLLVEIEDLRKTSAQGYTFEDFTGMDSDENEDGDEDEYED